GWQGGSDGWRASGARHQRRARVHARLPLGPRQRAARSRSSRAHRGHRWGARPPSGPLRHGQRLSWGRHPRLRGGRTEDRSPSGRLAEETGYGHRDDGDSTELTVMRWISCHRVFVAVLALRGMLAAQSAEISTLLLRIKAVDG